MIIVNMFKNECKGIDIAKLFCAFLVIAIHTEPFHSLIWLDRGLGLITRIPVPFFFVCSGYFLFMNGNIEKKIFLKYEQRILTMYFIWTVIYFPLKLKQWSTLSTILIMKEFFIDGIEHLWFLKALAVSVALVWFLSKIISNLWILAISTLLLIIGTLFSTYQPLIGEKIIGGGG